MSTEREKQSEIIDIRGLLGEYASKWYLFVACIIICAGAAYIYSKSRLPVYDVNANLLISQDEEKGGAGSLLSNFGDISSVFGSKGKVDDEVFIVKSHSVLRETVKDLGINKRHYVKKNLLLNKFEYKEYPVDVLCEASIPDTLMHAIRFNVSVDYEGLVDVKTKIDRETVSEIKDARFPVTVKTDFGRFILNKTPYYVPGKSLKTTIELDGYNGAAEGLSDIVEINVANKKANVISLHMLSTDVDYAKDVLNGILANYNNRGIKERTAKSQKTAEFLDSRLALLSSDLNDTENGLESFKREQGLTDPEVDVEFNLRKKTLLEGDLLKAQTTTEVTKMLLDFVNDPANDYSLMPSTAVTADAVLAINSYNTLMLQRLELARTAKGHNQNLSRMDEQLAAMRKSLRESLAKSYDGALTAQRDLQAEVNAADSRLGKMPYQERIFRSIMRQQELKEQLYLFLLQRREETSMTLANSIPKGVIVDEAYSLVEPRGLKRKMLLLLGAFFGLCLAPAIIYIRRSLRNKFESKDELEKLTKVPVLGEVCTSRRSGSLVVKPGGSTSIAELFRLIRTNLQFMLPDKDNKVILMTSTVSGEGKSFISINLASSLSLLEGKRVLLVGMDIRAPKLAEYLPLGTGKRGLTEYLASDAISLDDIIMKDAVLPNMDIIAAGPVPPNPSELLLSKKVDDLFAQLRTMYDYIIVDSAPVGMVSDSFSLERISDATVYVCRANYTSLRDVKFFNDLYADKRLKKMGLVVNGTSAKKGYGYGYGENSEHNGKKRRKKS